MPRDQAMVTDEPPVDAAPPPSGDDFETILIRKSDNGGFIVECMSPPAVAKKGRMAIVDMAKPKTYSFESADKALAFVSDKIGAVAAPAADDQGEPETPVEDAATGEEPDYRQRSVTGN